tara:strand:+ start:20507 stop:21271 length:765 start_codon:yes stop_codon:yes gene_type:complete
MRRHLVSFVIVFLALSTSIFAAPKSTKAKKQTLPTVAPSIVEQAQQAIAVDPKAKVPHSKSPQETGILVMRAPDLNDDRYPTRYPVGLHLDSYAISGTAVSANNKKYDLSDVGSPLVPSLRLGMIPWSSVLFDGYSVQLGYQQKQLSGDTDQTLKVNHYTASVAGENKFYVRGNLDLRYQVELGLLQSQISSKENSLSNVTRKASFVGLGLQTQYHLHNSLSADLGVTYRSTIVKSEDFNLQPIGVGAGISYIW